MSVANMFKDFLNNLKVDNAEQVSLRYGEITKSLNQKFRDSDSTTANSLQVGSYGRYTGIKGISDLDMLYIMPKSSWDNYKDGKQSQLLTEVKNAIKARYPTTDIRVDRLVVTVTYKNFHVEVQPVFEKYDEDGNSYFHYPDTYHGGSWKKTKPRQEMNAIREMNEQKNKNLRQLCKMARAWRNKHGVGIGGLLIDTLAYKFMNSTNFFDDKSHLYFDYLSRDFFSYLADEPNQEHYQAPGSNQDVKVKCRFQKQAQEAHEYCLKAIESENEDSVNDKWRKVYGAHFPASTTNKAQVSESTGYRNTEEFIETLYPVDVRFNIELDCDVSQNGFRENSLAFMLRNKLPLSANKKLMFQVVSIDVPEPYILKWKVLNRGAEAIRRDCIRGQIVLDQGYQRKNESTNFQGEHFVECYAIKDGVVVARTSIDVPIR